MLLLKYFIIPLVLLSLVNLALAHMEMSIPYPINSKFNPDTPSNLVDYSMTSPLLGDGSNYPCKGYQNQRPIISSATYIAGQTYDFGAAGSASHGGGSCQLSFSYDNGKTFRVVKSMIGGCMLTTNYTFTVPSYFPSGSALLAWTWMNKIGNREFYSNCAQVQIQARSTSTKARRTGNYQSFDDLPYVWRANIQGQNECVTGEGENPVFPEPGPDVEYGDGMSANSPVSPGICNLATPVGSTFQDLSTGNGDSDSSSSSTSPETLATTAAPSSVAPISTATVVLSTDIPIATIVVSPIPAVSSTKLAGNMQSSMVNMYTPSPSSKYTNASSAATSTSYTAYSSILSAATANFSMPTATTFVTQTVTQSITKSITQSVTQTLTQSVTRTLTQSSSSIGVGYPTASESPPNTPSVSTPIPGSGNGGFSTTCDGAAMGAFKCLRNGVGFAVCNWGQWIDMGSVAAGTTCRGSPGSAWIGAIAAMAV